MSYTISISDSADDTWMLSNSLFRWYAGLFNERFVSEPDVLDRMEITLAIQGVSLDLLSSENPALEVRFRGALRRIAAEIVGGHHVVYYDDGAPHPDQVGCRVKFAELISILDRAEFGTEK